MSVQEALNSVNRPNRTLSETLLPGPTGESNVLTTHPRGTVLCLGPGREAARQQAALAKEAGCAVVEAPDLPADALSSLTGFDAVISWGNIRTRTEYRRTLAERDGPILPLISEVDPVPRLTLERHLCIDTTAAGGNAALLAAAE